MYMNELFMKQLNRLGFVVAWAYVETVYLAITIFLGYIPLWVDVSPIIMKGLFWFFYSLRFVLLFGIIVRRIRTAGLPEIISWMVIFPPLQIMLSLLLSVYPGRYESWIPQFKKEINNIKLETTLFGGYGE